MRILFLHEVNYLTKPIFEMHEFPEHLAKLGHEVGFVHFPEGFSLSQIRKLGRRETIPGRVVKDVKIDLFTPWTFSGNLLGRLFTATFSYWQFKGILREYKPDVVVSFSVPTSGWQALLASRRANAPFVFRALDVSHKIRQGPYSKLVARAERFVFKHSDAISANNPAMLRYCESMAGRSLLGEVHSPPLDLSMFERGSRLHGRKALGLDLSEALVVYLGSFFYFSGLTAVIREFNSAKSKSKLLLIGAGDQDSELRDLVANLGLQDRVIFTGLVPYEQLPNLLAAADVAINPMEKTLVSNAALPNKVLQYMAAGVPVVSTSLDGLVTTFGLDSGILWGCNPQDVARIALSSLREKSYLSRSSLQKAAIQKFTSISSPMKFARFLEELVNKR